jgi:hypothetical protein
MRGLFAAAVMAALGVAVLAGPAGARSVTPASGNKVTADFNGDGYSDLAIGELPNIWDPGSVNVLYGSVTGPSLNGTQLWSLNHAGIYGTSGTGDSFGSALATGDFNGDGDADLAIGVPYHNGGRGEVVVLYGGWQGLHARGAQYWTLNSTNVRGAPTSYSYFGSQLATGDFNGDGKSDLAISSNGTNGRGAVNVMYGSSHGLAATGNRRFTRGSGGILGQPLDDSQFGYSLATGDFDGNGDDDLAIGVPYDTVNGTFEAGSINVIYGFSNGLQAFGNERWTQDSSQVAGSVTTDAHFGLAIGAGDFNGDGRSDLMVGAPSELVGGAIISIMGSDGGLTGAGSQLLYRDSPGMPGSNIAYSHLGSAIAAGDFNGDGKADLVLGDEAYNGDIAKSGAITVVFGSPNGITTANAQFITPSTQSIPGAGNAYGQAVTTGDFDGNGDADIVFSADYSAKNSSDNGAIFEVPSNSSGPKSTGLQRWARDSPGVPGLNLWDGRWGSSLGNGSSAERSTP